MNLEDNFKDKLERRRLEPTASAWDRIEGKLDASQGKKKSKIVLWMGIAASFIAGVFITALIYNTSVVDEQTPYVENQPEEVIEKVTPEQAIDKPREILLTDATTNSVELQKTKSVTSPKNNTATKKKTTTPAKSKYHPYSNANSINSQVEEAVATSISKEAAIKPTINAVVGVNPDEVKTSDELLDDEVENLLKAAQQNINKQPVFAQPQRVVDANELLLDAEAEVDPDSFKDRMFRTLKKEFNRAVEAVANKDN
ncbi:hypothetical protein [Dokdonia donghaensis]|uniref:Uncharacterized protein n=1 Tax=Dokdonia donghaensis DSW-1 TaxID=1300343 RepID=A0A0A2H4C9_9FLAO|nr:hypothetical protein [Dokdonia donghaensis]ANH60222.1 hypothetical protein I597_1305 [Dokdonia donghaensis DSW-1]KGO07510.1 hypothetical protein NV36_12135 [Dokdonia donghaensis DSW-1]